MFIFKQEQLQIMNTIKFRFLPLILSDKLSWDSKSLNSFFLGFLTNKNVIWCIFILFQDYILIVTLSRHALPVRKPSFFHFLIRVAFNYHAITEYVDFLKKSHAGYIHPAPIC